MKEEFETIIEDLFEKDSRYREDAYIFVMEALTYTQKKYKAHRHVSGEELLVGIRDLLMKEFGPLAITVLTYWGVKSTEDFGNIVFNLVDNKVLSKTEDDNIEEFKDVFDFDDVFKQGYRKKLHQRISRMRAL